MASSKEIKLYSFDIFDTLVTRRVATPVGIFSIIQHKIQNSDLPNILKENFFRIRIEAEDFAKTRNFELTKSREITFDDIYKNIQINYNLSDEQLNYLKDLEIQTEINNLVPLEKNLNRLKSLQSDNKRVVLITDMYYTEADLKKILPKIDKVFENIKIYSSSEFGTSKYLKNLYKIVKEKERIEYKNWEHCGDHRNSDIKNPKSLGIKTCYTPQIKLKKYQQMLLDEDKSNLSYQMIIGSSRLAMINGNSSPEHDFGASFGAPILYNYVKYVLDTAQSLGLKTLYFVARDGYVPKLIADIIIEEQNLPIKTKYIYGSRLAWRVFDKNDEQGFDKTIEIIKKELNSSMNLNMFAHLFGMDVNDCKTMFNIKNEYHIFNKKERERFCSELVSNTLIKEKFLNAIQKKYELTKLYLQQEIDLTEDKIGFVDLQGSGKTQDYVATLLNTIKQVSVYSFYIASGVNTYNSNSVKLAYFSTDKYKNNWVELLSGTVFGQTLTYKKSETNKWEPVLETINLSQQTIDFIETYQEGIMAFTKQILEFEKLNNISNNSIEIYCKFFQYFMKNLDFETSEVMGKFPYSKAGKEKGVSENSQRIKIITMFFYWLLGKKFQVYTEFPSISIGRSGKICKNFAKFTERFPTVQKFLFNIYTNRSLNKAYFTIFGIKISINKLIFR